MTQQPFDVVRVPFPFTDRQTSKRRPALVLSTAAFQNDSEHLHLAMITSASNSHWSSDWPIQAIEMAGLSTPCVVRFKLFTLDQSLILGTLGHVSSADRQGVQQRLHKALSLSTSMSSTD